MILWSYNGGVREHITVATTLPGGRPMYWRVRYRAAVLGWQDWSDTNVFVTSYYALGAVTPAGEYVLSESAAGWLLLAPRSAVKRGTKHDVIATLHSDWRMPTNDEVSLIYGLRSSISVAWGVGPGYMHDPDCSGSYSAGMPVAWVWRSVTDPEAWLFPVRKVVA